MISNQILFCAAFSAVLLSALVPHEMTSAASLPTPTPTAAPQTAVISMALIRAKHAADIVSGLFPKTKIRIDGSANALVVTATPETLASIRTVVEALDVRGPDAKLPATLQLHSMRSTIVAQQLRAAFPGANVSTLSDHAVLVVATKAIQDQVAAIVTTIDSPPTPAPLRTAPPAFVAAIVQADPRAVAHTLARVYPLAGVSVSGANLVVTAPADQLETIRATISDLDHPPANVTYTQVYHLRTVDAASVADLLQRSFGNLQIQVNASLNAITLLANAAAQKQVAAAIAQVDSTTQTSNPGFAGSAQAEEGSPSVIALRAVLPPSTANGGQSSVNDIAQTVQQSLAALAPDLKISVLPNTTKLILTGSAHAQSLAKALIDQLDVPEPLVELDTEILEIDEDTQKQLGFKFPTPLLGTTFSEVQPASSDGSASRLIKLQPIARTPLSLGAELDFLVSTNRARILEDPRITTFSGHTASIHAGETVNVLTTTGGGTGTVATTQIQSFQTGVTLDITPVVNTGDYVTVTLHPSVNSEAGISSAGVPNIQTRDTSTTIGLQDGETVVIGGLIEDNTSRSVQKVPFLGDLPLIGALFRDTAVSSTRNELVVTVTPHILHRVLPGAMTTLPLAPSLGATPSPSQVLQKAPATLPPIPSAAPLPAQATSLATSLSTSTQTPTPSPSAAPAFRDASPNSSDVFEYGNPAASSSPAPGAGPQILYLRVSPSHPRPNDVVTISVLTTTDVSTVMLNSTNGSLSGTLGALGNGRWRGTFTISGTAIPGPTAAHLLATNADGQSATLLLPIVVVDGRR